MAVKPIMATNKSPKPEKVEASLWGRPITLVILLLALSGIAGYWLWNPDVPQLAGDAAVFTSVDALFTATTSHDSGRLRATADRLRALHSQGKIADPQWRYLEGIVAQADRGKWDDASRKLYRFMRGQRRETDL